ncbi:MAG: type II toxin-antitoxin system VapC family toxin [Treponemataceae bacterium]|nr:type II toxin-antitoxin system VapC family toxin [Spirochaetales bacterium]MDY6031142.1 type II toxin-antitoxin system VapC family toxin [Treponemataceae bacterium]
MIEYLLDTHILLWLLNDDERLTSQTKKVINNPNSVIYYSIISMWEVAIKHNAHPDKMNISGTEFMHYCEQAGFKKLEIDDRHIVALESLEVKKDQQAHKDPFDRVLLSQAKADGMNFITHDEKFAAYDEPNVWIV